MAISAIKQEYIIVKSVLLISFLFVISLGLIGGCSDGGGQNDATALTENDFAEDSSLRAELDEGVVVTFLEAPNSEPPENDTGQVGVDLVPLTYRRTAEQTFCWEDDDVDAMHFMELRDSEESLVLTVQANGDCVTELIAEGNYIAAFHHDESVGYALPIFIKPNREELAEATKTDGFIDGFKLAVSNVLKRIEKTVTKDAKAQTVEENINTLLSTKSCVGCNLSGADLSGADLSGANLFLARLNDAILTDAILTDANMDFAKFESADLTGAVLRDADLRSAVLRDAVLRDADLRSAVLYSAVLVGADLSGVTWCDGCICAEGSIGECGGCQIVGFCIGF